MGGATGSEALFLNPAGIAARKRYTVDAFYLTDRRPDLSDPERQQDYFGTAVVDSISTPVAAGMSWARESKGLETGTLLRLALAGNLYHGLYAGVQANYFDLQGLQQVSSNFNADAGLLFQVTKAISAGGAAYNLLANKHHDIEPRGYGFGISAGSDTSVQVMADYKIDLNRESKTTHRYGIGAEYLLAGSVPIRAGYQVDDILKTRWWAAGLGYVTKVFAADVGFRQSTTDAQARTFTLALRLFLPNE